MVTAESVSLRPTSAQDRRELCVCVAGDVVMFDVSLSQIAYLGEQCNRIVYAKLAGAAESGSEE